MIEKYESEISRFNKIYPVTDKNARESVVADFLDKDSTLVSWSRALRADIVKNKSLSFKKDRLIRATYRPFTQQWMYFDRRLNEMVLQMPKLFPAADSENLIITFKERWNGNGHFALITNSVLEQQTDGGAQCFPLYLYDIAKQHDDATEDRPDGLKQQVGLFPEENGDLFEAAAAQPTVPKYERRDAITDAGLAHFQEAYPGEVITKEDLFYYVYGLLHSPDYRERYADNLSKELPRIPRVKPAADFWAFSQAGRDLAELHLNYETVRLYPLTIEAKGPLSDADYRVEKMKFAKKGDKTTVIYNGKITLRGIPEAAWDYVVNGKAALDWVMERQSVKTDKASGIVNDANDWAIETMGNPKYPLELFQRVVTVSLETQKIVAALPSLNI